MSVFKVFVLTVTLFSGLGASAGIEAQRLSDPDSALVEIVRLVDRGEYQDAERIARQAIENFPQRGDLYAMLGEVYYKTGRMVLAEEQFRLALNLDHLNEVAKYYLAEIESTAELQVSSDIREWNSVARDKVGDFIIFVIGIWVGTTLNTFGRWIYDVAFKIRSRKALAANDYDLFTDMLELQLSENNFSGLRYNLKYLLRDSARKVSRDDIKNHAEGILHTYVNSVDNVDVLVRMLKREFEKSGYVDVNNITEGKTHA